MCVANLNVSTQPCTHRWYTLVRSCSSEKNLSNCPEKLRLEGWESRRETCPWCDETSETEIPGDGTHKLFCGRNSGWRARRTSSETNSDTSLSQRNSLSRTSSRGVDVVGEVESSAGAGGGGDRGEEARLMNWRLDVYLLANMDRKVKVEEDITEIVDAETGSLRSPAGSLRRSGDVLGRRVKRSMRLGKTMFKG